MWAIDAWRSVAAASDPQTLADADLGEMNLDQLKALIILVGTATAIIPPRRPSRLDAWDARPCGGALVP